MQCPSELNAWVAWHRSRDGPWRIIATAATQDDCWLAALKAILQEPRGGNTVVKPKGEKP